MRHIIILMLFAVVNSFCFAQSLICNNLWEIKNVSGKQYKLIRLNNGFANGEFIYSVDSQIVDSGVVIQSKDGGFWVRQISNVEAVSPSWWGAVGDGISDDYNSINSCIKYALRNKRIIQFPTGVFRITKQLVIGAKPIQEVEFSNRKFIMAKSYNSNEYVNARFSNSLIIKGGASTLIYGDFESASPTAIFYFGAISNGNSKSLTPQFYNSEISNIGFYGKDSFIGIKMNPNAKSVNRANSIGIAVFRVPFLRIESCKFFGLDVGLLTQDSYFSNLSRLNFAFCNIGINTYGHNSSSIENIVSDNCRIGLKLEGSVISCTNIALEYCATGIVFSGEGIIVNGLYCENDILSRPNDFQIKLVGASGVIFNATNVTSGGREIIFIDNKSFNIKFCGSTLYGSIVTQVPISEFKFEGVKGKYPIKRI